MAFAPSASWNLRSITLLANYQSRNLPMNSSDEPDFTESYLLAFEEELTEARDPDGLINAMKKRFPSAELLLALERGAKANVEPDKKN